VRQRDLQPVRLSEAVSDFFFTCAARTLLSPGNDPAAGLHLPANERTDLHERNMPEEAPHMSIIKQIDDQIAALKKKKAAIQKKCSHPAVKSKTHCDDGNILTGRDPSSWTDHTCELCGYQWQTEKKNG